VGGVYAYILGSNTCNIGDQPLIWQNDGTPGLSMNAYRLFNGRLQQIGMGMAKTACCVANSPVCGQPSCVGPGGHLLPGCQDTYSAGFNAGQSNLKPRKFINAFTGAFTGVTGVSSATAINGRMQVQQADMDPASYPGALFFFEGHYVCTEDANNGNWGNNASYTRVSLSPTYVASPAGAFNIGKPAINAWKDHGLGVGVPDPNVTIQNVDVPGEGRFIVGSKVTQTGKSTWHYEYAIHNFNSDRSGQSFRVPLPAGTVVSNAGFSDVAYNSEDAIYDGTNWSPLANGYELRWSTAQTYAQNVNANALRWGTMYNFWFDCDRPPIAGRAEIDLFKPAVGCQPSKVEFSLNVPGNPCDADVARNGMVDATDLLAVIGGWGACACPVNCPANVIKSDSMINVTDLLEVIGRWGPCP
jgi:hypothetical protein